MRLHAVANRFNKTPCVDAYTGEYLFDVQVGLYDDNKRDSETAERRTLSVDPAFSMPPRRVVEAAGSRYILGSQYPDVHNGKLIRMGLVGHEATYLSQIRTIEQACLDQDGTLAWSGRAWVKNMAYREQDSVLTPVFHLHYSTSESLAIGMLVTFDGILHIVRSLNYGPAGTLIATCEEVPEPSIEMATVTGTTYDPVTDTSGANSELVRLVRLRWQSLFEYRNNMAPKFGPGDVQLAFAKSAFTPVAGMDVTMSDGTWQIASALDEGSIWLCRAVRHG